MSDLLVYESHTTRYVTSKAQALFAKAGCQVYALAPGERYKDASGVLSKMSVDVDAWPAPPAGLFVVAEKTLYLRKQDATTTIHEYGHAIDCALGGGVYTSGIDPFIREAFADAKGFVTPYAATGMDEFFAECWRAYCEANSESSTWPKVTKARLREYHPAMFEYFESKFA